MQCINVCISACRDTCGRDEMHSPTSEPGIRGQRPRGDTDARLTAGELDEYSTALKVD